MGGFFLWLRRCNIYFKSEYYKKKYPTISKDCRIGYECLLDGDIKIGKNTYLQRYCQVVGDVTIGDDCSIASGVCMWANTHIHNIGIPDGVKRSKINIGNNVWIGTNAFIREGITIGDNCIIGANSMVTHNVPDNTIVGGVPAKIISKVTNKL